MKAKVYFDTDPDFNCTRIEYPDANGNFIATPPTASDIHEVDMSNIPTDRTFRAALMPDLSTDMPKARAIHMDRIRAVRNAELGKLDVPQMTANSKGDLVTASAIETQKQKLRDLPQTFDLTNATTPQALKILWPPELPKE